MSGGDLSLEQATQIQEAHADERRRNLLVQCAIDVGTGQFPGNVRFDEAVITTAIALEAIKRAEQIAAREAVQLSDDLREIGGESLAREILAPPPTDAAGMRGEPPNGYFFWFNARGYRTDKPSMTAAELKRMVDAPMENGVVEHRGDDFIYYSDDQAVDLTRKPQLFTDIEATP